MTLTSSQLTRNRSPNLGRSYFQLHIKFWPQKTPMKYAHLSIFRWWNPMWSPFWDIETMIPRHISKHSHEHLYWHAWLVVYHGIPTPLKSMTKSQLGWLFHPQDFKKIPSSIMFQSPSTSHETTIFLWFPYGFPYRYVSYTSLPMGDDWVMYLFPFDFHHFHRRFVANKKAANFHSSPSDPPGWNVYPQVESEQSFESSGELGQNQT